MTLPLGLWAAAAALCAVLTLLATRPGQRMRPVTLMRLLPLSVAADLLLSASGLGPALLPVIEARDVLGWWMCGLLGLNLLGLAFLIRQRINTEGVD